MSEQVILVGEAHDVSRNGLLRIPLGNLGDEGINLSERDVFSLELGSEVVMLAFSAAQGKIETGEYVL